MTKMNPLPRSIVSAILVSGLSSYSSSVQAWLSTSDLGPASRLSSPLATPFSRTSSTTTRLHATLAGFGVSDSDATVRAVNDAVEQALGQLGDKNTPSIAFISSTVKRDLDDVRKQFVAKLGSDVPIHGITSSGAILTTDGPRDGAVGCLLLSNDQKGAFVTSYDANDGAAAAKRLKDQMPTPDVIFLGSTPGAEEGVLESLNELFPDVPVFGGTAADDELAGDWKVASAEEASGTGVSLVGISGDVKFGASMLGPYEATSKKVKATKTDGRRVFEIDDKPAADWVLEWLGDDVKEAYEEGGLILPQTSIKPIGIKQPSAGLIDGLFGQPEYVTCHLAALGGPEKYVDFFTPIPEGSELIVMDSGDGPETGYSNALKDAFETAKENGSLSGSDPTAGMLIYCGGMAIAVGDNLTKGLTSNDFKSKVGSIPMMGMTCFGEQANLPKSKKNVQRNLSVGCVLFG